MQKTFTATPEDVGVRLDVYLSKHAQVFSRSRAKEEAEAGHITVNGKVVSAHYALRLNEVIAVNAEDRPTAIVMTPWKGSTLDILHEDADIIVLNKPSGMLVHPAVPTDTETLANALLAHFPKIAKIGDQPERPGIVHRLDRDASGLLVVAKTKKAFEHLKQQFQAHEVRKEYAVLVEDHPPEDAGTVRLAIGRKKGDGKMAARAAAKGGDKEAVTHYSVDSRWSRATLLTVRTETGRTHQIRAHMFAIGCPVVGDSLYGTNRPHRLPSPRLFLHAKSLTFTHPKTGEELRFEAPLPKELVAVVKGLGKEE